MSNTKKERKQNMIRLMALIVAGVMAVSVILAVVLQQ